METMKMAESVTEKRISPSEKKESAYRRSNKPLMEKKRRARINSCLTQLKTLVLQAMRKDTNQYSKLEKADILEMTVKHLRQLQRQQISAALSHDPTVATKYRAGFNECANEVVRYLGSVQGVNGEVRSRLLNHLGSVVSTVNSQVPVPQDQQPQQQQQNIAQPLNVQIPQHHTPQQTLAATANVPSGCLLMTTGVVGSPISAQQSQQQLNISPMGHSQTVSPAHQHHQQQANTLQQTQIGTEFCGSFQIIPHSAAPGAVAVYLGKATTVSPHSDTDSSRSTSVSPVFSSHTPPRTKASLKAFDSSAFSQVPPHSHAETESHSPSDCLKSFSEHRDFRINGISVSCGRTPSPLKIENVWRPW